MSASEQVATPLGVQNPVDDGEDDDNVVGVLQVQYVAADPLRQFDDDARQEHAFVQGTLLESSRIPQHD